LTLEEFSLNETAVRAHPELWNKGKLVGQKAPFKLREIWTIRGRLQLSRRARDLALFDLGIDSKLRLRSRRAEGSRHLPRRPRRERKPSRGYLNSGID
jgi:hypothetical protein